MYNEIGVHVISYRIKICLVGDGGVGKTSLRYRYLGKGFKSTFIETLGADLSVMEETINGKNFTYQIWDLAGQQKYENLTNLYYVGSQGFILVFDLTRPSSYENIMHWVRKINEFVKNKHLPAILIGNKLDLRDEIQVNAISTELGQKLADNVSQHLSKGKIPVLYIETSAKTGENVAFGFKKLNETLYKIIVK